MQDPAQQDKLELRSFLLCLVLVSIAFLWVLKPFFGPIFWACALAVIFYPMQQKLLKRFKGKNNLTALFTLLVCIVIVILPVIFVITSAVNEGVHVYQKLESGEIDLAAHVENLQASYPIDPWLARIGLDLNELKTNAGEFAMTGGKFLAQHTLSIGQNAFGFILDICLMLYLTFFMLRDGQTLLDKLVLALPLGDERERLLFSKFAEVTRATVKGTLVVAVVQGSLGGLIFWFLGIPGVLLWSVFMAVSSLIPAVGPALIWAPVAVYLVATGEVVDAVILVAFGVGVIGLVDNILRPILVGRDTKMPDYVILLTTLGGLALFGINGFVVGPLVAALFIAFWGIFAREINNH